MKVRWVYQELGEHGARLGQRRGPGAEGLRHSAEESHVEGGLIPTVGLEFWLCHLLVE